MNKQEKQIIIDTYFTILNEFFTKFLESEISTYEHNYFSENINYDEQINYSLYIGIRIIHRVFDWVFVKTKNISFVYYYCNSAFSYYLEYIEQIFKSCLLHNFNYSDAILFVYKKTIFEISENREHSSFHTLNMEVGGKSIISNIIQHDDNRNNIMDIDKDDFIPLYSGLTKITDILLSWKHAFRGADRIKFCQYFLEKMSKYIDKMNIIIDKIFIIYETIDMNLSCWRGFLEDILLEINKKNKIKLLRDGENDQFVLRLNMEKNAIKEKLYDNVNVENIKILTRFLLTNDIM